MRHLLTLCIIICSLMAHSQTLIQGTVTDARGQALPGVNLYVPSTFEGATTDSVGNFSFTAFAKTPFQLHSQYIGYRVDSIEVTGAAGKVMLTLRETATALSEVVISAGAFVASDTRKTAVLSSLDIATTGSTADLAEALSTLPGSTPAPESGQLLVRGGAAEETQAYINGMRVPKLYTNGLPDIPSRTRFSPFSFKGITFATGGFSAAYGDALSGALILETQDLPTEAQTTVGLLSLGAEVARVQPIGDHQAVALSFGGTHLGAYKQLNKEARGRLVTPPQGLNSQLGYWWKGRDGRNLKVFAQGNTQHFESFAPDEVAFYGNERLRLDNQYGYAQAVYQQPHKVSGLWEFGSSAAGNRDFITADGEAIVLDQLDLQSRATYANNFRDYALWKVGAEQGQRRERVDIERAGELNTVAEQRNNYSAAFMEADWFIASKWVLRTGLRADGYYNETATGDINSRGYISPRGQLNYLFSSQHQLAVSAGRNVQRQTNSDLFATSHNLESQSVDYTGLTYSRSWDGRVLRAEAYAKTYRDLLTVGANGEFETAGNGYSRGLDIFYRDRKSVKNADFWVSYSYNESERLRGSLTERAPVTFAARHNVAVVAKRFFPKPSFGVSATYRFHSGRAYDNPNAAERFASTTPNYHDVSLNVTYLTNIKGHFTVIFASLSNVAGTRQVHQYRYAQQPDASGNFDRIEVDSLFPSFPFVGMFVTIGDKNRVGSVDDI